MARKVIALLGVPYVNEDGVAGETGIKPGHLVSGVTSILLNDGDPCSRTFALERDELGDDIDEAYGLSPKPLYQVMKGMWEIFRGLQISNVISSCTDALDMCAYQPYSATTPQQFQTQVKAFQLDCIEPADEDNGARNRRKLAASGGGPWRGMTAGINRSGSRREITGGHCATTRPRRAVPGCARARGRAGARVWEWEGRGAAGCND